MDILLADWLGKPLWMWSGFLLIVFLLLAFDLGLLNRGQREIGIASSLRLSASISALPVSMASPSGGPSRPAISRPPMAPMPA